MNGPPKQIDDRLFAMLHARTRHLRPGDTIAEPLTPTSIYHLPDEPRPDRVYGRIANPTVQAAEARLALLEAAPALLFSSGMAAYAAVIMATVKAGDTVLMLSDGYYAARNLMDDILSHFGIAMESCPTADIAAASLDGVRLAIVETPTNPHLDTIDIAALSARCRAAGCMLAVDNTVCTAVLQQPLDRGADIVIAADTKAAAGHSDLLLGHVASRDEALISPCTMQERWLAPLPALSMPGCCCAAWKRSICGLTACAPMPTALPMRCSATRLSARCAIRACPTIRPSPWRPCRCVCRVS